MKTPEGIIKDKIRAWLREQGAYVFSPTQMGYGQQTLDLLCCIQGRFVAIEVKAPGKKLTTRQHIIGHNIAQSGGRLVEAHCLEDVINAIPNILR